MRFETALFLTCPHCGTKKGIMNTSLEMKSGNNSGATLWSDAKEDTPESPTIGFIQQCPECKRFYFLKKQGICCEKANDEENSEGGTGYIEYPDLKQALEQFVEEDISDKEEAAVRFLLFQTYNDYYYRRHKMIPPDAEIEYFRNNVKRLLELRECFYLDQLLIAEMYRETGNFEQAEKALPTDTSEDYVNSFREQIAKKIKDQDSVVFELKKTYRLKEGLAVVWRNGKYGYIDRTGKEIFSCIYDYAKSFHFVEDWPEAEVWMNGMHYREDYFRANLRLQRWSYDDLYNDFLPAEYILHGNSYAYRIERMLGQGTFSIVYLATMKMGNTSSDFEENTIQVAIKEFFIRDISKRDRDTLAVNGKGEIYDNYKFEFSNEVRNLKKLNHKHIIKVFESFEANGTAYYAMEYVKGKSLHEYIKTNGRLSICKSIDLIKQIGSALSYIHTQKMLYLDMKPVNVMLRNSGEVVLINFGLSKQYDDEGNPESGTTIEEGTPGYAPIEQPQYRNGTDFPVTMDVYALGATLFEMLTGEKPAPTILNEGFPACKLQTHRVSDKLTYKLQAYGVNDKLIRVIGKALAPIKQNRYPSVSAFMEAIDIKSDPVGKKKKSAEQETKERLFTEETRQEDACQQQTAFEKSLNLQMVYVQGGTFMMGAQSTDPNEHNYDSEAMDEVEAPVHQVTLSDYYIGKYEVTQAQWKAVMGSNPSYFTGNLQRPVENVSWDDIQEFIRKLNEQTGKHYALPTEAQWEYAARGGNKRKGYKYSGSTNIDEVAWYRDNIPSQSLGSASYGPQPVGTKAPNELGLYDMSGNVWEWCKDWYGDYNTGSPNSHGPSLGFFRVIRGGGWDNDTRYCRVSHRGGGAPDNSDGDVGFRLALLP